MSTRRRSSNGMPAVFLALLLTMLSHAPAFAQRNYCDTHRRGPSVRRCVRVKRPPPREAWKAQQGGGWQVIWAPYLWGSALDGDIGVGGHEVEIDMSFGDVLDHLDYAIFLPVEMRHGRWATVIELMASKISGQRSRPRALFETVTIESNQMTIEMSPRYRITRPGPVDVDLIAGFRLWQVSSLLRLSDGVNLTTGVGEMWFDPIVGSRAIGKFGNGFIQARGDVGGVGVGSKFSYQLLGILGYNVSSRVALAGGYRYLSVDFEDDDDDFLFDVAMKGFLLGVAVRLGGGGTTFGNGPIPAGK